MNAPTFDDVFAVMAVASLGESARVALPEALDTDDPATKLAVALNVLLDDLAHRTAELAASEARYRALFEDSPMPAWVFDAATLALLEVNAATVAHYGYERDELLGMTVLDLASPDHRPALLEELARPLPPKHASTARQRRKDGSIIQVELTRHAILHEGRNAWFVTAVDITERVRADEARVLAESRFGRLLEAGLFGVVVRTLDGEVVELNETMAQMLGYSRDELLSGAVPWSSLTPEQWRERDAQAVTTLETEGVLKLHEKAYLRKDGTSVPVLIGAAPLGGPSGEMIGFVLDITERKRAEAAVELLLRQSERDKLFSALLDAAPDALVIVDEAGCIELVNAQTEVLFGYPRAELLGQPVQRLVPERFRTSDPLRNAGVFSAPRSPAEGRLEVSGRRKDGTELPIEITLSPLETEHGLLVSSAIRDITERRRTEAALELVNRELESFSYSVAHDLRAPLRGMNGFAQVLVDRYADRLDSAGLDYLQEILLNARKMGALIDALLGLSRVTRTELKRESVDLSAKCGRVIAQLAAQEPHRQVAVEIEEGLSERVDPNLARALFENLVGNAWKFTSNVKHAKISFGCCTRNGGRAFFVRDNGAGFDMAYAAHLFGAFQRLHRTSEFEGTGIGLATVQRIVHRHGGRVWAEGVVDGGATFYFTFAGGTKGET